MHDQSRYGITVGQIYVAADGSHSGHIVIDVTTYASVGDAVTIPFSHQGQGNPLRIDAFKLARVRFEQVDAMPDWYEGPPPGFTPREAAARAMCVACGENPDHSGDAQGNPFRWQDYLLVADAVINAMAGGGALVRLATPLDGHDLKPENLARMAIVSDWPGFDVITSGGHHAALEA